MLFEKSQSAIEYLTTYGWAIVIIAVVLAALYQLGFFSGTNFITTQCLAVSGFTCQQPVMNTTGWVSISLGQISNGTLTVTGVACTNSTSQPGSYTGTFISSGSSSASLQPGQTAAVAFQCPGIGTSGKIGTPFRGYLWIQYNLGSQTGLVQQVGVLSAVASTTISFITPPYIFCVAGVVSGAVTDTYYAPLPPGGGIGSWTAGTAYKKAVYIHGCVSSNGYIYCVGGAAATSNTYYAPISSAGIGSWSSGADYLDTIYGHSCATNGADIYCVGGQNAISISSDVYYAPISSTGIGSWSAGTSYKTNIYAVDCSISGGYIYCIGGTPTGGAAAAVTNTYYAPISSTGIGMWSSSTAYKEPIIYPNCAISGSYIYCTAGGTTSGAVADSYYAPISSTGIGTWSSGTAYKYATENNACVIRSGRMYCVGGSPGGSDTYYAPVSSTGIGSWSSGTSYKESIYAESCATN